MTKALEVKDLYLSYKGTQVLHGISFSIDKGEMITLLGSSGCGKSTTLRSIAGLETPSQGVIKIDNTEMFSSEKGINVPTEKRGLSMVFQSYAIWPHMTVYENVAYGLKIKGFKGEEIKELVHKALKLVQLDSFADRPAPMLSGGQQQRVALARSIAYSPKIMLFDEPLSNLDAKLRQEMREQIRELQQQLGFSGVYVTHDQEEALAISDRIIAMNKGHIDQDDIPEIIFEQPRTTFVAQFMGTGVLVKGKVIDVQDQQILFESENKDVIYCQNIHNLSPETINWVSIKTCHINKFDHHPDHTKNVWPAEISNRTFFGNYYGLKINWNGNVFTLPQSLQESAIESKQIYLTADEKRCIPLCS